MTAVSAAMLLDVMIRLAPESSQTLAKLADSIATGNMTLSAFGATVRAELRPTLLVESILFLRGIQLPPAQVRSLYCHARECKQGGACRVAGCASVAQMFRSANDHCARCHGADGCPCPRWGFPYARRARAAVEVTPVRAVEVHPSGRPGAELVSPCKTTHAEAVVVSATPVVGRGAMCDAEVYPCHPMHSMPPAAAPIATVTSLAAVPTDKQSTASAIASAVAAAAAATAAAAAIAATPRRPPVPEVAPEAAPAEAAPCDRDRASGSAMALMMLSRAALGELSVLGHPNSPSHSPCNSPRDSPKRVRILKRNKRVSSEKPDLAGLHAAAAAAAAEDAVQPAKLARLLSSSKAAIANALKVAAAVPTAAVPVQAAASAATLLSMGAAAHGAAVAAMPPFRLPATAACSARSCEP